MKDSGLTSLQTALGSLGSDTGECPAAVLRRELLSGARKVEDLYRLRGVGRDTIALVLLLAGLETAKRLPDAPKKGELISVHLANQPKKEIPAGEAA